MDRFPAAGKGDPSCLGPLSGLEKHKQVYAKAVQALTDPARTRLVLVSRAQTSSLSEIERTYFELNQIGIGGGFVVVNGVLPEAAGGEELAQALREGKRRLSQPFPRRGWSSPGMSWI